MPDYDNTNSGALFNAANQKLLRSGPCNIGGEDETLCVLETKTKTGKTVYEVYQKLGAVFVNERKTKDSQPDVTGKIEYQGLEYWMSGWKKESKNGQPFTSVSFNLDGDNPRRDSGKNPVSYQNDDAGDRDAGSFELNDEIPF